MSTIEERIVSMTFKGSEFLAGVQQSIGALEKLNATLKNQSGTKGLDQIGNAAQNQAGKISKIGEAVDTVASKFKSMSVIAFSVLNTITSQAVLAGENLVKSLTFKPLTDGFHEYETNLNAIQTILANTAAAGTNLKQVNAALNDLNHYSDQTIYNFSEMARNIGTFTAAGVALGPAVASIKGIANLAALSGSNAEQASTAMYQLSQAISAGRVSLEDWNSVVNAGMGGTVFQRALALTAEKVGTLDKGAVKLTGSMKNVTIGGKSFRDSITAKPGEKSWLTSDVLTKTLAQFTGDLTNAQLKAEGFNASEIKAIQAQAKMAKNAATQVKTFSQLVSTLGESVGSGWTQTWQTIFGDFGEAKTLFTNVNNVLGGFVQASANARNKVLADWKALGGRTAIINTISNSFNALISVVKPIKAAFREIFPATTGKQLAQWSKDLENFTKNLKIGGTTANNIKRTFAGLFAVIDIGWQVVKKLATTFFDLVGIATDGSGGFLEFTGNIGDFLVGLDQAIKKGEGLTHFFKVLETIIGAPIKLIKKLAGYLGQVFDGFDGAKAAKSLTGFAAKLSPLTRLGSLIGDVWGNIGPIVEKTGKVFQSVFSKLYGFFSKVGDAVQGILGDFNFTDILHTINTGLFAGLVLLVKKFIDKIKGAGEEGGGFFSTIKQSFSQLTDTLSAMQTTLKATTLLEIAAAVGILTLSVSALSKIDAAGLTKALTAITVMFTQLMASMTIFQKISGFTGFAKMPIVAASLVILAVAVDVLAVAVERLAKLDWNGLAKGLTGVTVLLGALVGAMHLMPNPKGLIFTSTGLVIMAAAIKILASAVTDLSGIGWEDMAKGLLGVGALLGALTLFTKFAETDKGGILAGAGLVLLAVGVKILASAVGMLAGLSWEEIGRGLVTLAGSLAIITAALAIIPPSAILGAASVLVVALSLGKIAAALEVMGQMSWSEILKSLTLMLGAFTLIAAATAAMEEALPGAAALLVVALSLGKVADALGQMGGMSWSEIGKSLTELAGSLLIITVAMIGMTEALPGAAALLVVAGALLVLTPVLETLGQMSLAEIGKSLLALAGVFVVLGVAAALLTPVIPSIAALGAAVALLGVGLLAAGAGVLAFAAGLTLLAASGAAATAAVLAIVSGLIGLLPMVAKELGLAVIAFAQVIAQAGPAMTAAITTVIMSLLDAVNKLAPKITDTFLNVLSKLLSAMLKYVPHMTDVGLQLLVGFLNGVAKNIGRVVTTATNLIVAFINAVSKNQGRVIDAGVKLVISFVNGLANSIRAHSSEMQAAGRNLAFAIIDGMTGGLASGVGRVASMARSVASSALSAAKSVLGIHSPSKEFEKIGNYVNDGFAKGLKGNRSQIDSAFNSLKSQLSDMMRNSGNDVDSLTSKLKKLTSARHKDYDAIKKTKAALAEARKEHKESSKAYSTLTKNLSDEHAALDKLSSKYADVATKLQAAQQTLADAKKTRDDFNNSIKDQYDNLPDISNDTNLSTFTDSLKKEIEDTQTFANVLQSLRSAGLSDSLYKELLSKGTSALPFAQELLAAGKGQIDQLNQLSGDLDTVSAGLAKSASSSLYDAAVNAAAGLVKGLQNQEAAIQKQMDKIAAQMVAAIKKALGIKSPSRVFAEVGQYSVAGLVQGFVQNSATAEKSAADMGQAAVDALSKVLSNVSDISMGIIDSQPVIKPVLDLTDVKRGASQVGGLFTTMPINVGSTTNNANNASDGYDLNSRLSDLAAMQTSAPFSLTQNNYSPKALSTAELYRQSKNLISKTKAVSSS